MSARIPIGRQITALTTAKGWLRSASIAYLTKVMGVRSNEIDYVMDGLVAAETSLEWLAMNRPLFEEWLAEKKAREAGEP